MKLNRILQLIFIIGTASILGYAGFYVWQQQALLRTMKISFEGLVYETITLRNIAIRLMLKFTNYSDVSILVDSYDFDVLINNQFIMKLLSPGPGLIKENGDSVTTLRVSFDPIQVFKNGLSGSVVNAILFDYTKAIITIRGTMSITHAGIPFYNLPVETSSSMAELLGKS